jgi:hypothetical protein
MSESKVQRWKTRIAVVAAMAMLFAAVTIAQKPDSAQGNQGTPEKVAALKESLAQNQAALKTYTWTEATEISLDGEVKKREQKKCSYGPDGKVQKTPIQTGEQPQQKQQAQGRRSGGVVKGAIVKNKVEDLKEYMEKAAALVHEYVPPDPQKIQAAAAAGNISTQPASSQGAAALTIKDYLKAGDRLILGFDPAAKKLRSYQVQSYVEKPKEDAVTLAVTFASLPDGTNYVQQTVLDVAAKKVRVKTTNSGHAKK